MAKEDIVKYQFNNFEGRTPEEQHEIQVKGGKASGEARRKKATMLAVLDKCLDGIPENITKDEINIDNLTHQELVTLGLIKGAEIGNPKNYELIYNIMQEKEQKDEETNIVIKIPATDVASSFVDLIRDIEERRHREYYIEGGRGSAKSSIISEIIIALLENNPSMCCVVLRKVKDTLKDSVFSQLEWAINILDETYPGLKDRWKLTKSPMEITNLNTGQKIFFRGADDYGKIKSLKPPKDKYIGITWYEEYDQFKGMNEVRKINQSLIRGGEDFIQLYSYNTPPSTNHFVNKEKIIPKESRLVHLSDYRSVPKEWLGQAFIDEAEYTKEVNEKIYENEYLGLMTGEGGNVFENVELREITDEEINSFDYIQMGIDFGWYPDPLAWTKMHYEPSTRILYIFDEYVINKQSNADVWEYLQTSKDVSNDDIIIADSAEPKSIGDFKSYGANIHPAEKGPGSVDYSMKWLASLNKIVIDQTRCPNCAREFIEYEYEQDKDGNYISGYVDANNHCIDSVRYGLNRIWKKKGN